MGAARQNRQSGDCVEPHIDPPAQNPKRHLIIAGTGRAGTSFLVRYLTELGLDTTLARNGECSGWNSEANAGLEELPIFGNDLPYVVKSPWISECVEQILANKRLKVDAFIVPVRDLVESATSRAVLEQRAIHQNSPWMAEQLDRSWETHGHTPGGVVFSLNPLDQARLLAVQFHRLVLKVSEADIPLIFPVFPRIATDWEYLHRCLGTILPPNITAETARSAHARVADAAKVRVTNEILKDGAGDVIHKKEYAPRFPSQIEVDNIGLRREIARLRQELREQSTLREQLASELQACATEFERERAVLETTIEKSNEPARTSIRNRLTRLLRVFTRASPTEA
jgi:hypothetical protein